MVILNNHNKRRKKSMKKIFTILAVLGALTFIAVPAHALLGMPDDQPGTDAVWWFLTDFNYPASGTDVLAVFTNTDESNSVSYHYTVFTVDSVTVYDASITGSEGDIFSMSGNQLITDMGPGNAANLKIDLDLDGTDDHWAGYVYMDQTGGTVNQVLGQFLPVSLLNGQAAMANIPMKEYDAGPYHADMTDAANIELFSANSLKRGKDAVTGILTAASAAPNAFALYPRYMINDSGSKSYLVVWKSALNTALTLHVNWWNAEEDAASANIPLPHELNFYDVSLNLPAVLHTEFPKEGWIYMRMPYQGNGITGGGAQEWLAWTWLIANGSASTNWSGIAPVARNANALADSVMP